MRLTVAAGLWVLSTCAASAQPVSRPIVGPDVSGSVGWLNVNKSELSSYDDWYNRGVQGALAVGWHWSVHVKTELEASVSSRAEFYASTEELINGLPAHVASEHAFRTRRLTMSQQYQFGENAWFHPHLAAGVDFNWETSSRIDRDVYFYDVAARQPSIRRPIIHPDRTDLHARPFAAAGFKAYMTPRAFFRSDLRVIAARRIEEVLLRFGFGVDF